MSSIENYVECQEFHIVMILWRLAELLLSGMQVRSGCRYRSHIFHSDDCSDTETVDLIFAPNSEVTFQVGDNVLGLVGKCPKIKMLTPIA